MSRFRIKTSNFNTSNLDDLASSLAITVSSNSGPIFTNLKIINLNTSLLTGSTINAKTLSATNFKQSYSPISLTTGSSFLFFGDSIVVAAGVTGWSTLISNFYNTNQINLAIHGADWSQTAQEVYNNTTGSFSTFIGCGVNDIDANANISTLNEIMCEAEAVSLFSSLPSKLIQNARNVSTSGTWFNNNNYTGIGLSTTQTGASMTVHITGQYVAFCTSIVTALDSPASYPQITVSLDGNVVNAGIQLINAVTTNVGQTPRLWFYDTITGAHQSHTLTITTLQSIGGFNGPVNIDWITGFDNNPTGCNSVILNSIQKVDCLQINTPGSEVHRQTLNNAYRQISRKYRLQYGIPIYFCDETGWINSLAQTLDGLHPNNSGHYNIYQRILNVLQNGEYNYLSS